MNKSKRKPKTKGRIVKKKANDEAKSKEELINRLKSLGYW